MCSRISLVCYSQVNSLMYFKYNFTTTQITQNVQIFTKRNNKNDQFTADRREVNVNNPEHTLEQQTSTQNVKHRPITRISRRDVEVYSGHTLVVRRSASFGDTNPLQQQVQISPKEHRPKTASVRQN